MAGAPGAHEKSRYHEAVRRERRHGEVERRRFASHLSSVGPWERLESSTWALENLFKAEWDERVPRDSDGRILLDESRACVKNLVHALLARPALAKKVSQAIEDGLSVDDKPDLLHYTARVLGLSGQSAPVGMSIQGGTAIFEPHE
ncbi:unnamed protein product, partial [Ectocarpus sp. 8 AP-2014]